MSEPDYRPGDWVRFFRDGRLKIGVVQYAPMDLVYLCLETDEGPVAAESVLECRPAPRTMPLTPNGGC